MPKRKPVRKTRKKPSRYNPWHFHRASNITAAKRIYATLQAQGKDCRIKPTSKGLGFTVWERN
jgi:hypothetical protein